MADIIILPVVRAELADQITRLIDEYHVSHPNLTAQEIIDALSNVMQSISNLVDEK